MAGLMLKTPTIVCHSGLGCPNTAHIMDVTLVLSLAQAQAIILKAKRSYVELSVIHQTCKPHQQDKVKNHLVPTLERPKFPPVSQKMQRTDRVIKV